jgi:hypothetical protein
VEADLEAAVPFAEVLDLHVELSSLVLDGAIEADDHGGQSVRPDVTRSARDVRVLTPAEPPAPVRR